MVSAKRPTVAVYKFSSCDGCQLSLLNLEDELLEVAQAIDFAFFLEAQRGNRPGPYDITLVEGSVTTEEEASRIKEIRRQAGTLIALGTCATSGGIQALRNFLDYPAVESAVYSKTEWVSALEHVTPISDHVKVDLELWGCPVEKGQVVEVLLALLQGRRPMLPTHSVCLECKRAGQPCVLVSRGVPCLGPITRGGCGALCPGVGRGCFGCFGPVPDMNEAAMADVLSGVERTSGEIQRLLRHVSGNAPAFVEAAKAAEVAP